MPDPTHLSILITSIKYLKRDILYDINDSLRVQ